MKRIKLFDKVLSGLRDGMAITFNRGNVAFGDDFLIFSSSVEITVTFRLRGDLWWVDFDGEDTMLLEDVPTSFLESIIKNMP